MRYTNGNMCDLNESSVDRDQGIIEDKDLSWKQYISTIVNKANRILEMLKKAFICMDPGLWKDLW